jgi:hypothetical protein
MFEQTQCDQFECTDKCSQCDGTGTNPHLNSADRKYPHCSGTGICPFSAVNITDDHTVGDRFRLVGCGLLIVAVAVLLLFSTASLVGKGSHTQPIHRVLAGCVLLATSIVLFITVRIWDKLLLGALFYESRRGLSALLCGGMLIAITTPVPTITRHRLDFLELLTVLVLGAVLCARYWKHDPSTAETVGLVGLVISLSFSLTLSSILPALAGATVLGLIQLVARRQLRTRLRLKHLNPQQQTTR